MIRKSIALFLAVVLGTISAEADRKAIPDKKFMLSVPHFSQSETGETEVTPYIAPLKTNSSTEKFPESFDLRAEGKISDIRDQTGYGTCWAHSAIASAESSIIGSKPEIDLSEFHTAYYTYSGEDQIDPVSEDIDAHFNRGGNIYAVTNLWSQWIGPVSERKLKYGDTDFFSNEDDVCSMKFLSDYHMKNAYMFDFDEDRTNFADVNNLVKQFVYGGNAVDVSFISDMDKFYNAEYACTNSNKKPKFSNHSVAIVGWDDNFPADNFKIKPENNGAWLAKNSWGTEYGEDGFFWISYEDSSLCEFAVYELEDADDHIYNFYHDTFVSLQSLSVNENDINEPSYMANVFYSEGMELNIDAISTYINVPDTDYEITVYTNLTDKFAPVSGTPSVVTRGKQSLTGYITIPLDDYVYIEENTYFSVVVKLYSENSPYVIPVETCLAVADDETGEVTSLSSFTDYYKIKQYTNENESFYSRDGENWIDVCGEEYIYTEEEEQEILAELEYDLFDGIAPDDTTALENAQLALEVYRDLFNSGTTSVAMGNISLKALGKFDDQCGFSHNKGVVPDGTKIELYSKKDEDIYYYIAKNGEFAAIDEMPVKYTEPIEITDCCTIFTGSADGEIIYNYRLYIPQSKFKGYGDVDGNGLIDAVDASLVLENYAYVSTGYWGIIEEYFEDYADINKDGNIDATDASDILLLYSELSTK